MKQHLSGNTNLRYWDRWCRHALFMHLRSLRHGQLTVHDACGTYRFGTESDFAPAEIEILDTQVYRRIVTGGSLAAADAFVDGLWKSNDLTAVLRLFARSMDNASMLPHLLKPITAIKNKLTNRANRNSRSGSKKNISFHYDLSNEFFAQFLDPTMTYSSGVFDTDATTLEEASQAKYELICRKLDLRSGDHVLEVGCGWGGFAEYAAKNFGCRVLGVTISQEQFRYAQERIANAGLLDRVELLLCDYRDLEGGFDKIVSIEMIEAVGHQYLHKYFAKCCSLLKPHGQMLVQGILMPDQRYESYRRNTDFIQKYIFPGGCLPSLGAIHQALAQCTDMRVLHLEDFAQDYAQTLVKWRENFQQAKSEITSLGFDERFQRVWEYYFCYCIAGFLEDKIGVAHLLLKRA